MEKLTRHDLFPLEKYADVREEFRAKVMAHKQTRQLQIGPNTRLYFEDRLTMQYQIQEILRVERIFEAAGIEEELEAYNPMIPDGNNWKATFMIEYEDPNERAKALKKLLHIEDHVWLQIDGCERIRPIADEDLERETEDKTSAVHFLRFDLTPDCIAAAKAGKIISIGIDHTAYSHVVSPVPDDVANSLRADL